MATLFVDTLLENTEKPPTRVLEWALSLAAHRIFVAAMFGVPMHWIDRIADSSDSS